MFHPCTVFQQGSVHDTAGPADRSRRRSMSSCPVCEERLTPGSRFCPWCGAGLGATGYPTVSREQASRIKAVKALVILKTSLARHGRRRRFRSRVAREGPANVAAHRAPPQTEELARHRQTPDNEARRHRRHPVQSCMSLVAGSERHAGRMENLSTGGLFVVTDAEVAVDQQLHVCFTMPGNHRDTCATCEVRWRRSARADGRGLGLRFVGLNPVVRAELESFCRRSETAT